MLGKTWLWLHKLGMLYSYPLVLPLVFFASFTFDNFPGPSVALRITSSTPTPNKKCAPLRPSVTSAPASASASEEHGNTRFEESWTGISSCEKLDVKDLVLPVPQLHILEPLIRSSSSLQDILHIYRPVARLQVVFFARSQDPGREVGNRVGKDSDVGNLEGESGFRAALEKEGTDTQLFCLHLALVVPSSTRSRLKMSNLRYQVDEETKKLRLAFERNEMMIKLRIGASNKSRKFRPRVWPVEGLDNVNFPFKNEADVEKSKEHRRKSLPNSKPFQPCDVLPFLPLRRNHTSSLNNIQFCTSMSTASMLLPMPHL
ncbi:hypothetical protein F5879DRAFT_1042219 [Lentinula edodes]|nr:hypothetical protein F5879DRAFT_1042219 [Lentinula edodes]